MISLYRLCRMLGSKHPVKAARLASSRAFTGGLAGPSFGEGGNFRGEPFSVIGVGIKVVDDPFREFGVAFVLGILDGLEEFGIAPGAAAIFWRAATADLDQARIEHARLGNQVRANSSVGQSLNTLIYRIQEPPMTTTNAGEFRNDLRSAIRRHWILFLIPGVVMVVLGLLAAVVPFMATLVVETFLVWRPFAGVAILTLALAAFFAVHGIVQTLTSLDHRRLFPRS